jgi:hypothetical protein
MIFMVSLANHLRPAFGTGTVNAALTCHMRFFMPALGVGANTIAAGAGAGFVTTTLATSTPFALTLATLATLATSATKDSVIHKI